MGENTKINLALLDFPSAATIGASMVLTGEEQRWHLVLAKQETLDRPHCAGRQSLTPPDRCEVRSATPDVQIIC